jgi:hypothetical protein
MNPHIPEQQRKWLGYRLLHICGNYGLRDPEAQKVMDQFVAQAQKYRQSLAAKHQPMPYIRQVRVN